MRKIGLLLQLASQCGRRALRALPRLDPIRSYPPFSVCSRVPDHSRYERELLLLSGARRHRRPLLLTGHTNPACLPNLEISLPSMSPR